MKRPPVKPAVIVLQSWNGRPREVPPYKYRAWQRAFNAKWDANQRQIEANVQQMVELQAQTRALRQQGKEGGDEARAVTVAPEGPRLLGWLRGAVAEIGHIDSAVQGANQGEAMDNTKTAVPSASADWMDRELQWSVLRALAEAFPGELTPQQLGHEPDERKFVANMAYLGDHGLISMQWAREPLRIVGNLAIALVGLQYLAIEGRTHPAELGRRLHQDFVRLPTVGAALKQGGDASTPRDIGPPPIQLPQTVRRTPVFVGVDVQADGRFAVTLWRGGERNAVYALAGLGEVLARQLPQALEEAVELAQGPSRTEPTEFAQSGAMRAGTRHALAALCSAVAEGRVQGDAVSSAEQALTDRAEAIRAALARLTPQACGSGEAAALPMGVLDAVQRALCRAVADGNVPGSPAQSLQQRTAALADALLAAVSCLTDRSASPR